MAVYFCRRFSRLNRVAQHRQWLPAYAMEKSNRSIFSSNDAHLNHQSNRRFGVTSMMAASPSSKPALDL